MQNKSEDSFHNRCISGKNIIYNTFIAIIFWTFIIVMFKNLGFGGYFIKIIVGICSFYLAGFIREKINCQKIER